MRVLQTAIGEAITSGIDLFYQHGAWLSSADSRCCTLAHHLTRHLISERMRP